MSQYENKYFTKNKNSKTIEKAKRMASKARAKKIQSDELWYGRKRISRGSKGRCRVSTISMGKKLFIQLMERKDEKPNDISDTLTQAERVYAVKSKRFPRQKKTFKEKGGFQAAVFAGKQRRLRRCYRLLNAAAKQGNFDTVRSLLSPGIDVNHMYEGKRTLLFYASSHNHPYIVSYLLKQPNIQPNKSDVFNITPLWIASHLGYTDVVSILIGYRGTRVNQPDMKGQTPLITAVCGGHYTVITALLKNPRTNRYRADNDGNTPESIAIHRNYQYILQALTYVVAIGPRRVRRVRRLKKRKLRGR
jgi:hypothetical protein